MSVECCGESRPGRFCPDCGAKLIQDGPITWLMDHCREHEKANRTRAANHLDGADSPPPVYLKDPGGWRRVCSERARESESKAAAWKARGDALAALVRGEGVK